MQRSFSTPRKQSDVNPLKIFLVCCLIVFMTVFIYGAIKIVNEIESISVAQQILITKLDKDKGEQSPEEEPEGVGGETVSRIEFVKFKNETNRTIRELTLEISRIQTKLKMKRTSLKK